MATELPLWPPGANRDRLWQSRRLPHAVCA